MKFTHNFQLEASTQQKEREGRPEALELQYSTEGLI